MADKKLAPLYYIYGNERFKMNQQLENICHDFGKIMAGVNYFVIDNDNIQNIRQVCEGVSFLGAEKLVIIKDTGLSFSTELLSNMLTSTLHIIVIEQSPDKRTVAHKYLVNNAKCIECNQLTEKECVNFVISTITDKGLKISLKNAEHMVMICGIDQMNLSNECLKISLYANNTTEITQDIIDKVCLKTAEAKIFDVISHIISNEGKEKLIVEIDDLLKQEVYAGAISALIFRQLKQAYLVQIMSKQMSTVEVKKRLSLSDYVYTKVALVAKKYTTAQLVCFMEQLEANDYESKIGLSNMEYGLKQVVLSM